MTISVEDKNILMSCAQWMARHGQCSVSLFYLDESFFTEEGKLISVLAGMVEEISAETLTVRRCDRALYKRPLDGMMCMVVYSFNTLEGKVTTLSDDMTLYQLGPFARGMILSYPK